MILVTGAAGLIGSHLVDSLLETGHKVVGIDDLSYGSLDNLKQARQYENFFFDQKNVLNIASLTMNFKTVFHLASIKKTPSGQGYSGLRKNIEMGMAVADYCISTNARLVFTSTSDVYGNSDTYIETTPYDLGPPTEERYSYAMSKACQEQYFLGLCEEGQLDVVIPRIFGCFSERSNHGWSGGHIPIFIDKAMKSADIEIHGDGSQSRCMSFATDIAYTLAKLYPRDTLTGEIVNIGNTEEMSVLESAKLIRKLCKSTSKFRFVNKHGDYREIKSRIPNLDKAKNFLDHETTMTTKEGIQRVINEWKK